MINATSPALTNQQRQLSAILCKNSIQTAIGNIDAADIAEIKALTLGLIQDEVEQISQSGCAVAAALIGAQGLGAWPEVVSEADAMTSSVGRFSLVRAGFNLFSLLALEHIDDLCYDAEHRNHVTHIVSAMAVNLAIKDHAASKYICDAFVAIHNTDFDRVEEFLPSMLEVWGTLCLYWCAASFLTLIRRSMDLSTAMIGCKQSPVPCSRPCLS